MTTVITPDTIVVATVNHYGPQPVTAIWQQDGLAVHGGVEWGDKPPETWTITHVRSGWAVRQCLERDDAIRIANELLRCGDWTQDFQHIVADDALYAASTRVLRRHGYRRLTKKTVNEHRRKLLAGEYP